MEDQAKVKRLLLPDGWHDVGTHIIDSQLCGTFNYTWMRLEPANSIPLSEVWASWELGDQLYRCRWSAIIAFEFWSPWEWESLQKQTEPLP